MQGADLAATALTGVGGISGGAVLMYYLGKSVFENAIKKAIDVWLQNQVELRAEVKNLREEKIVSLQTQINKIQEKCKAHAEDTELATQAEKVKSIKDWMTTVSLKLDEIGRDVSAVQAVLRGKHTWIQNLTDALDRHRENQALHGGHRSG